MSSALTLTLYLIFLVFFVFVVIYAVSALIYRTSDYYELTHNSFYKIRTDNGAYGEYLTWKALRNLKGYKKFLFNCYVPKDNGESTEIDVLLLHESGIYVLESKNYSGWIFGTESQQYWTQTLPSGRGRSHKERFFNPILQNSVHLKWLSSFLDTDPDRFVSVIVFSNRCELKKIALTSGRHYVIKREKVLSTVKEAARASVARMEPGEIDALYEKLFPLTRTSEEEKLAHIESVRKKQRIH